MRPGLDAVPGAGEPLLALLARCVVRVDVDGQFRGSGFFVAPGEVLTCAHVVLGAEPVTVATCGGTTHLAEVISDLLPPGDPRARFYPPPDVALLRLPDPPESHPCVQLDSGEPVSTPRPDVLHLDAYTRGEYTPDKITHSGAALEFERTVVEDGWWIYKLSSGQVVGGFSGGPLLNRRTAGVCAVLDSTRSEHSDLGGFGVPMPAVLTALPGLGERNAAFQATDRRWRQAREDQNRLVAERDGRRETLPLLEPMAQLVWQPGDRPSDLLRPRYSVVPFVPRGELLGQVMRWREADDRLRVLILTGAGGLGKTRTAIEICGQARWAGWTSGLLHITDRERSDDRLGELAGWPGRLVVAVDYAETRPELVADLLWKLCQQRDHPACRVVLIVRQSRSRTELVDLFAGDDAPEELTGLMRRAEVVGLGDRELELDRRELFDQALTAFVARLNVRPPVVRVELRPSHFEQPLFVLAAALLAVSDPDLNVSGLNQDELLGEILTRHEARYWNKWNTTLGAGLDREDQRLVVALAALMGATTSHDAERLVQLLLNLRVFPDERTLKVKRWLRRLYGSQQDTDHSMIQPLEPDLLAEALVAGVVTDRPELIGQALDTGSPTQLTRSLLVLSRIASSRDAVREAARQALDERLPAITGLLSSPQVPGDELSAALRWAVAELRPTRGAINCTDHLPEGGPALTTLAIEITALATDGLRPLAQANPTQFLPHLALLLSNQSVHFGQAGRPAEGLRCIEEAVNYWRGLAEGDTTRYQSNLAGSLVNQSELLAQVGRPGEGLGPAQEAVNYYRVMTKVDIRFLPELATSLNSVSNRLGDVGRAAEALSPIHEAVIHYRALAKIDPDRFRPDLTMSLTNLSNRLGDVGRPAEALGLIEEVVAHYRALANADPALYLPNLALSLNNQSKRLVEMGRPAEGLGPVEEAVAHYRALANADPTRFLPELANSLNSQASWLAEAGRPVEGLGPIQESVTIRRVLAKADPTRFLPDLAKSLNNQSNMLADAGRPVEGLGPIQESVTIRRVLAKADPTRFLPDLAWSLVSLSGRLAEMGRPGESLTAIEQAVTHYRALAEASPSRFLADLAMSLNSLSSRLAGVGRPGEGLGPIEEAVTHFRALAEADPSRFLPDLAASLINLSSRLAGVGRPGEGLGPIEEAVTHFRALAEADPVRFRPDLALSLNNLSNLLAAVERPTDGLDAIEEAVTLRLDLAGADATRFLPDLAGSLQNLADLLTTAGRADEVARRFADMLADLGQDGWPQGVLLLARARWHYSRDDFDAALADSWHAVELLDGSDDARYYGEARFLLRAIRAANPVRFDQVWQRENGTSLPVWLRLSEPDSAIRQLLTEWIDSPTWQDSFAFLTAHADALFTDSAEANLEHLVDEIPDNNVLTQHLELLRAAQAHGIEPVYAAVSGRQRRDQLVNWLLSWISTPTWEESERFLTEHVHELVTIEAEAVLASLSADNPSVAELLRHLGLLSLARHNGIRQAYALREDPEALTTAVASSPDAARSAELLAATRLDAGLHPDSGEAHLRHALAALDQAITDEAEQAIQRCADSLASWQRPAIRRQLTTMAEAHPNLDVDRIIRAFNSALDQRDGSETSTQT